MFKIGVLVPRSSLYPMIGADVLNALKAGLRHCGQDAVEYCTDNIGFGGNENEVYARAEKMLLEQEPQLVIAYLEEAMAATIQPLFEGYNTLLLVINPGANIPEPYTCSPLRYSITLQAALGSRLTAGKAAQSAKKFINSTSFYEGGYLSCFSMARGMELGGGAVYYHDVVPYRLEEYNILPLKQAADAIQPDAVLAQFSAEAGAHFLKAYAGAGLDYPLHCSPFLLEEEWLEKQAFTVSGFSGYTAWVRQLDNPHQQEFQTKVGAAAGREANVFHLLGWEAALFAGKFLPLWRANSGHCRKAAEAVAKEKVDTPRGQLVLESSSRHFFSPMYFVSATFDKSGSHRIALQDARTFSEEELREFVTDQPQGVVSRWKNTYLCI